MEWEPQDTSVLWMDFTMATLGERTVHSVDDIMRDFSKNPKKYQKSDFSYDNNPYKAYLFPSKYSKLKSDYFDSDPPQSYPDSIRYLFNIKSPFVIIKPISNRPTDKDAHIMISAIIQAAQSSSFNYPIFLNIPLKQYYKYIGICISEDRITHFYSSSEYKTEIKDYLSSLNFFSSKIKNIQSILYSSRRFLEIDDKFFIKDAIYTHSCFYSVVKRDPITKMKILFQWNRTKPDSVGPLLPNASFLKLSVDYQEISTTETPLHIFVNKRISLDGKDDFKLWRSERLDSRVNSFMNSIFHNSNNPLTFTIHTSTDQKYFKSAPEGSLLERVAIEIAEMKTLANFAMIWCELLKNIRFCAEQSIPIPGIDGLVDYKNCLVYQNLQVINSFIKNRNKKFLMAENFFEQYIELYKKARKEQVLTMLVVAYKNQNENATFESFQKVLLSTQSKDNVKSKKIQARNKKQDDDDSYYEEEEEEEEEKKDDGIDENIILNDDEILKIWNSSSQDNFQFDPKESIEFALDYLEGLKPSEVHLQIVSILFDIAIRDLSKRAPIEIPFASISYDLLIELFNDKKGTTLLHDFKVLCRSIEETTLHCEIVNSALSKIPSANFVNQLFEKGYSSTDKPEEIQSITSLLEVMNLNKISNRIVTDEYIFTGKAKIEENEIDHYLFVSNQKKADPEKYIIALSYQDLF